jgi:hypothetical protein
MLQCRATLATKELQDVAFSNVIAVIMNLEDWSKRGYALVKEELK